MTGIKRFALSLLSILIFLAGIFLELSLSGAVLEGEIEARAYTPQIGDSSLTVRCPHMLSPTESGTVSATITNTLDEETKPVITAEISSHDGPQQLSQTLELAPHETQNIQWTVNSSNKIFGRLILVNIVQSRYADLSPRQGACGILVLNLFKLKGISAFFLVFFTSLLCIALGAAGWLRAYSPLNDFRRSAAQACGIMTGMATAGLLAALPRWWGLTLFFDAFTLIVVAVVLTEFLLFPGRIRN
jgi:hypothetical protein